MSKVQYWTLITVQDIQQYTFLNSYLDTRCHERQNLSSINFSCNGEQEKKEEKREIKKI